MNQVQIDIEKRRLTRALPHDVRVPELFEQCAWHKRLVSSQSIFHLSFDIFHLLFGGACKAAIFERTLVSKCQMSNVKFMSNDKWKMAFAK